METYSITVTVVKGPELKALEDKIEELRQLPILTTEMFHDLRVLASNLKYEFTNLRPQESSDQVVDHVIKSIAKARLPEPTKP